jgi:hypothetical protein
LAGTGRAPLEVYAAWLTRAEDQRAAGLADPPRRRGAVRARPRWAYWPVSLLEPGLEAGVVRAIRTVGLRRSPTTMKRDLGDALTGLQVAAWLTADLRAAPGGP